MRTTFTLDDIIEMFPMTQSCLTEDGTRVIAVDDKATYIEIEIKDKKIEYLFWRKRKDSRYGGIDFRLDGGSGLGGTGTETTKPTAPGGSGSGLGGS